MESSLIKKVISISDPKKLNLQKILFQDRIFNGLRKYFIKVEVAFLEFFLAKPLNIQSRRHCNIC